MSFFTPKRFLVLLAIVKFILPFVLHNSYYQLHRDEYLYLAEGDHLAWGFLEVPPLLPFLAWITNGLGGGFFWVKFWPNLFGVFTLLLTGNIVLALGGKKFALFLACMPFVLGGYLRLFYLLHPTFLDVFFWTLMAFGLFKYINTSAVNWLYVFGLAAGLGMMSKYSTAFYCFSLLLGLALTPQRKVFLNRHLYFAGLLALVIFLPNFIWQYNHNFPLIFHMRELQEEQLQFISPVDFIVSQLMMGLPFVFIWIAGLLFGVISRQGKQYRLFTWAYLAVIGILIAFNGKDYYALGAYPILFAVGGFYLEKLTAFSFQWIRYAMVVVPLILCAAAMPLIMPMAKPQTLARYYQSVGIAGSGLLRWEDQRQHELPQDFADMIGWREMAEKASAVYHSLPKNEQQKTMIYARGYYTAGALNYYRKQYNLPTVYSDNASFLFWMPDEYHIDNLLLVGYNMPGADDIVFQQFEQVQVMDSVNMPLFREHGMKFILFENGTDSLNALIERSVAQLKDKFIK